MGKFWDKLIEHAAECAVAALSILLVYVAGQLAPVALPLLDALSNRVLLALMLASLLINVLLALLIYYVTRKSPLRLKYGIYWDKERNPHCPACEKPVAAYGEYNSGWGYYCKPCGKVFPLADAAGNDKQPADVVREL